MKLNLMTNSKAVNAALTNACHCPVLVLIVVELVTISTLGFPFVPDQRLFYNYRFRVSSEVSIAEL